MSLRACARDLNQPRCAHTVSAGGTWRNGKQRKLRFYYFPNHSIEYWRASVFSRSGGAGNVRGYFLSGCAVRPLRVLCASCGQYADISSAETVSQGMRETGTETRLCICPACPLPLS